LAEGADVLVLACTHLPFLAPAIARLAGPGIKLVDPSTAVARQLQRVLTDQQLEGTSEAGPPLYYSTGEQNVFAARLSQLLGPLATPVRSAAV
jgi:glutamate racemase